MKKLKFLMLALLVSYSSISWAQSEITGVVVDDQNVPLPGANVVVKGTTNGVVSDFDGNFTISVGSGLNTLEVSYIGYMTKEVILDGSSNYSIQLEPSSTGLDEVVVVGYGTQKKSDLTGAIGSVSSENFNKGVAVSPQRLLQGKIAGVNVTSSSGEPGAAQNVTIRGPGSIRSGNGPLYVVDGVPLGGNATTPSGPDMGFGGQAPQDPLNFINPNDIQSIDVLKDASAAAIYGSRGSNGVIIITTKTGKRGKSKVEYNTELGISNVAHKIDVLTADEFRAFQRSGGGTPNYIESETVNTDWQDQIFRTAFSQNHRLSLSNASENSNYFASISYIDQEGVIKDSGLKRYTGRVNLGQNVWEDKLKIKFNLTASQVRSDGVPIGDRPSADGDLITNALIMNPTMPPYNADGSIFDKAGVINPMALLDIYTDFTTSTRILGNVDATLNIIKGLDYRINLGVDNAVSNRSSQISRHDYVGIQESPEGRLTISNGESRSFLVDNILTYDFSVKEHKITAMAGFSYQNFFNRGYSFGVRNFSTDEIEAYYNPIIGGQIDNEDRPRGSAAKDELQSFFGRLNYAYSNKYLLTATLRHDGSSRFGQNNKYATFPSFSAAWRLNNEDFLSSWKGLSNLKLRAGWGQTGNQELPSKQTLASVVSSTESGTGYPVQGDNIQPGIRFVRNENPDLKWEVVTQTNLGLDFGFFQGNLYGSIDVFNKTTTDALLQVNVVDPLESAGGATLWKNLKGTEIVNKGLELALAYGSSKGDFTYDIGANATFLNNVIHNLSGLYLSGGLNGPGLTGETALAYIDEESIGSFYLPEFLGLDQNGQSLYQGADGTEKFGSAITSDDYKVVGSAIPNFTYNFFLNMQYRKFDFSMSFNGISGSMLYNNTANAYFRRGFLAGGNNVGKKLLDDFPNESNNNIDKPSSRYLEKGDFLRLNNASLGYSLDVSNLKFLDKLRLYVTGQNLFVITDYSGYDPEVNTDKNVGGRLSYGIDMSSYPKARTFILGVNVSF